MAKHLLLIGGGHAHMVTLANLHKFVEKGYVVSVIQPSEYHYYSGMGPGMLGGTYLPDDIRFATKHVVEKQGGRFILGRAVKIDPDNCEVFLEGADKPVFYDVLSCNAGSFVPEDEVPFNRQEVFTAKPIEALLIARQKIISLSMHREVKVAVIGGGPSAVEIAGNIRQLSERECVKKASVSLFSGREVMSGMGTRISGLVRKRLSQKGIHLVEGNYTKAIDDGEIILENNESYQADVIFSCIGVRPNTIFRHSGLATGPDGGLLVNSRLQAVDYPNIFGGGDCISFEPSPLDKVGVYAVRQNPVLFHNLMAAMDGGGLREFNPGGNYLLIYNLGGGEGFFSRKFISFGGRLAFLVKDYIDRKFVSKFQAME